MASDKDFKMQLAFMQSKLDQDAEGLKDQFAEIMRHQKGGLTDAQIINVALQVAAIKAVQQGIDVVNDSARMQRYITQVVGSTITIVRAHDMAMRKLEEGEDSCEE